LKFREFDWDLEWKRICERIEVQREQRDPTYMHLVAEGPRMILYHDH
jgi:hypothetical protein